MKEHGMDTGMEEQEMTILSIGGKSPFSLMQEGSAFTIQPPHLIFVYNYLKPTDFEIQNMTSGRLEVRSMVKGDCLWFFVKCGQLPWTEVIYNPHFDGNPQMPEIPEKDCGYGLLLLMTDARDATIKNMRVVGLGNRFSMNLRKQVLELQEKPYDEQSLKVNIIKDQKKYTTTELAKMCSNYWKL